METKPTEKTLFVMMFSLTILIGVTSCTFLGIWIAMELNLLMFIPFLIGSKSIKESESTIKYFLIQSVSSSMFLFSCMCSMYYLDKFTYNLLNWIIIISIITKMAAAPMHFWLPSSIMYITWINVYIMSIPQKILPLFVFMNLKINAMTIYFLAILGLIFGTIGIINQFSLKKLIAFSSVSHMSWILMALKISWITFISYFMFYSFILMEICLFFKFVSTNFISELTTKKESSFLTTMTSSKMLSLGGIPPFLGFYPKSVVVFNMMQNSMIWIQVTSLLLGTISLFVYSRTIYSSLLMNFSKMKFVKNSFVMKNKKHTWFFFSEILTMNLSLFLFIFWSF